MGQWWTWTALATLLVSTVWSAPTELSVPDSVSERFAREHLWEKYDVSDRVNPFYLRGDLDGDGRADYSVLVKDSSTGIESIVFVLTSRRASLVVEQKGRPFDGWVMLPKGTVVGRRRLRVDAVLTKFGGPGIVNVWNGKNFEGLRWGD